jgi:hypothetical protein
MGVREAVNDYSPRIALHTCISNSYGTVFLRSAET